MMPSTIIPGRDDSKAQRPWVTAMATATAAAAVLLSGCASTVDEHYYRLNYAVDQPMAGEVNTVSKADYDLVVATVQIPDAINRPQLVLQKSATESAINEDQRWLSPLDEQMTQAVVGNLRSRLPRAWVSTGRQAAASTSRLHLKIEVEQLQMTMAGDVALDVSWSLNGSDKKLMQRRHVVIKAVSKGTGYEAAAAGVSDAVQQLSASIAVEVLALEQSGAILK